MVRTAVLFLSLALAGGAPHFAGLLDLLSVVWVAEQADVGNGYDPNGATSDFGSAYDPNGATSTSDIGTHLDPNGATSDIGDHRGGADPNG
jgi:hypothetical protein